MLFGLWSWLSSRGTTGADPLPGHHGGDWLRGLDLVKLCSISVSVLWIFVDLAPLVVVVKKGGVDPQELWCGVCRSGGTHAVLYHPSPRHSISKEDSSPSVLEIIVEGAYQQQ